MQEQRMWGSEEVMVVVSKVMVMGLIGTAVGVVLRNAMMMGIEGNEMVSEVWVTLGLIKKERGGRQERRVVEDWRWVTISWVRMGRVKLGLMGVGWD